jgi:hypothetical protein
MIANLENFTIDILFTSSPTVGEVMYVFDISLVRIEVYSPATVLFASVDC